MIKTVIPVVLAGVVLVAAVSAIAKLPPPPPLTDAQKQAAEEKKEKDKASAAQAKTDLAAAEDRVVKNYHANMKQLGAAAAKSRNAKGK
jgi:hypothetical protein